MNYFKVGWYVMYTKPRHERKVTSGLADRKVESFFPTVKKLQSRCDRRKYIDVPLFPSYVFAYLKDMRDYYEGLNNEGVLNYVKVGKDVVRVHDDIVNNIKVVVDRGSEIEVLSDPFEAGQQLVIHKGPLTGLTCEVVQHNGKERILVRVQLLQRNLLIAMPFDHLMHLAS